MNPQQAWQATLGQLQMEMNKASFETWVKDAQLISVEGSDFIIGVPNAYARDWLESRLTATVQRILEGLMGATPAVKFIVWHRDEVDLPEEEVPEESHQQAFLRSGTSTINSRYTFDNFIVGASNRMAHAACMAVAESPAKAYNPLFLYGGVGLGKTHLLHAIGNAAQSRGLQVLYVSSEEFTNDLINAIRSHTTQAFSRAI